MRLIWLSAVLLALSSCSILGDVGRLYTRLYREDFWNTSTAFKFMRQWERTEALFASAIHFNVVDPTNSDRAAALRNFGIDDSNVFTTSVILYELLEAEQLGTITIDSNLFNRSLTALLGFRNHNRPIGFPQYTYWAQKNSSAGWRVTPANFLNLFELYPSVPDEVKQQLNDFGLTIFLGAMNDSYIPPDQDDSDVNIALLAYMKELDSAFYPYWYSQNYRFDEYFTHVQKLAYRPFAPINEYSDEIDTRTYFILHDFLKRRKMEAEAKGEIPSLILPKGWLIDYSETIHGVVEMTYNSNNLDGMICTYFLFAIISQIQGGYNPNAELRTMIRDATDLVVYAIEQAIAKRVDLILMYYPSKYFSYWIMARTVGLLERMSHEDEDIAYAYHRLSKAMREVATKDILKEKVKNSHGTYWHEFLGNFAGINRDEDAISSTASVVNVLLDAWGVKGDKSFKYLPETPAEVKEAVEEGVAYLRKNIRAKRQKLGNSFFSGGVRLIKKHFPGYYPGTFLDKENNIVDAQTATFDDFSKVQVLYVKGYIEDEEYQRMLGLKWFGSDVPTTFEGYNDGNGSLFLHWQSPAITHILMITALSKFYRATEQ